MVFFSKNTNADLIDQISIELGIPVPHDLGKYLGMPTINGRVTKQTFQVVSDRVDKN